MVVPETQTQENEDDEDEQVADGDDDEEEDEEEDAYEDCYWTNDIVLIVCQLPSRSYQRPYACSMCNHLNRPSRPLKQCRNTNTFYHIKWAGYDDTENTWEPTENLLPYSILLKTHSHIAYDFLGTQRNCWTSTTNQSAALLNHPKLVGKANPRPHIEILTSPLTPNLHPLPSQMSARNAIAHLSQKSGWVSTSFPSPRPKTGCPSSKSGTTRSTRSRR